METSTHPAAPAIQARSHEPRVCAAYSAFAIQLRLAYPNSVDLLHENTIMISESTPYRKMALAQSVDLSSLVCHLSCHGTILAQLIQLIGVFSFVELD